jgi:hypothetical protein
MKLSTAIPRCGLPKAAVVLGLGLLLAAGWFGCGRVPPPGFWEPDAADSTAIDAAVSANASLFETSFNELGFLHCDTVMPGTTGTRLRSEIAENPFKQRFRVDSMEHRFFSDSFELEYSFIATIDTLMEVNGAETTYVQETTATVTLVESIPGVLRLHAYAYTRYLRDSLFFPSPGETLRLQFYDTLFSDTSMVVEKSLYGTTTDGAVFKKSAGAWSLWKVAGGSRFYAPTPDDAPYLAYLYLSNGEVEDTIQLRPDTLQSGIQRFYDTETELPVYQVGDSLRVRSIATTVLDAANYSYLDRVRHEFRASDKIFLAEPGIHRLYFEQIPIEVLYEASGKPFEQGAENEGQYVSVVWGMMFKVEE